jgi:hypothetical protein
MAYEIVEISGSEGFFGAEFCNIANWAKEVVNNAGNRNFVIICFLLTEI